MGSEPELVETGGHPRLEWNTGRQLGARVEKRGSQNILTDVNRISSSLGAFEKRRIVRCIMNVRRRFGMSCTPLCVMLLVSLGNASAQSKSSKYACSEPNPAQQCTAANTCGSTSTPCTVDVKRTTDSASTTPSIPNAKGNSLFCVKVGTTVTWNSTEKDNGFVVDVGPASPFEPAGAIIGGSDRSVSVVAKRTGCFKYSAGACRSGAIYGMCDTANAELIVTDRK